MIETLLICFMFLSIGYLRSKLRLSVSVCSWVIIASQMYLITNDAIYNTSIIVTLSLFARFTQDIFIKTTLLILTFYYFIAFLLSAIELITHDDTVWEIILLWSDLYEYVYYSTILLILAGLARSEYGGIRNSSTSYRLLFNDNHSVDFKRI